MTRKSWPFLSSYQEHPGAGASGAPAFTPSSASTPPSAREPAAKPARAAHLALASVQGRLPLQPARPASRCAP
ncbi:hypothetical protein M5C99_10290 [Acidovorax sp. NCPPB 2350]|nr:hypothetical protein M5C99_10290 [Acidovorax sp. NCPPB 2350]